MFTFFHGWRRKMGAATLVMACVFAAGWMRSLFVIDDLYFSNGPSLYRASSCCGMFDILWESRKNRSLEWEWQSREVEQRHRIIARERGFTWSQHLKAVAYSNVVAPLALLSAYLLLSKPRAKKIQVTTP